MKRTWHYIQQQTTPSWQAIASPIAPTIGEVISCKLLIQNVLQGNTPPRYLQILTKLREIQTCIIGDEHPSSPPLSYTYL
jgi:hypothetical protein